MRNRRNGNGSPDKKIASTNESEGRRELDESLESTTRNLRAISLCRFWFLLHIVSVLCLAAGVILNNRLLITAGDCTMTYSRRQFLRLDIAPHAKYRLFKFMDERDPRHQPYMLGKSAGRDDKGWCSNVTTVLYVPGHFGSYEQSRSLGAHGVQLTERSRSSRELKQLKRLHLLASNSPEVGDGIEWFYYDVYALDFREEGGAFHGALLQRQAAFIANVVDQLTAICDIPRIHIVAHSIGGISARLALQTYPKSGKFVHDVITLGTPHRVPVWTWEPGIWNVYATLGQESNNVAVMAISGGLRDEMIPAEACFSGDAHLTMLSSQLMANGKLGMDHKAIVWCHNILTQVRSALFSMSTSENTEATTLVGRLRENFGASGTREYFAQCEEQTTVLKSTYGYLQGSLMEAGLLPNAEHLVFLYASIGTLRYLDVSGLLCVVSAMCLLALKLLLSMERHLSIQVLVVLSLSGNALHTVFYAAVRLVSKLHSRPISTKVLAAVSFPTTCVAGLIAWGLFGPQALTLQSIILVFALTFTLLLIVVKGALQQFGTNDKGQDRQLSLTTLVLPLLPLLILGDVLVAPEGLATFRATFVLLPLALRFSMAGSVHHPRLRTRGAWRAVFDMARWIIFGFYLWSMVKSSTPLGHRPFHPMAVLIMGCAMTDAAERSSLWL